MITAIRLTTDVITFAAIVVTIIVLVAGMIVAPLAIASWYPPSFSQISDNLRDQMREAGLIAPADPLVLDRDCANEERGCFPYFGEVVEEVAPQWRVPTSDQDRSLVGPDNGGWPQGDNTS